MNLDEMMALISAVLLPVGGFAGWAIKRLYADLRESEARYEALLREVLGVLRAFEGDGK